LTLRGEGRRIEGVQRTAILLGLAITLVLAAPASPAVQATARIPALYKNCTNLNKRYPHGVGKLHARDKTSGTPVTNFRRSNTLYSRAMSYNRGLDRDKDGIACEKK
jgi:excalibur calcium-binding domain-containing protein